VKAIILVAGRGSRLGAYGNDRPKCMVDLAGTSMIARQLGTLRHAGIDDIVLVTGYRADMLALRGTRQVHNADWADTNMVESLFCAEAEFGDDMIVAYGDIVYEPRIIGALLASTHPVSVVVDEGWRALWEMRFDDPLGDAETLRLDRDGRIVDIGQKPSTIEEIQAQYMGLMRFRGEGLAALRASRANWSQIQRPWMNNRPIKKAYMTDLIMEMILMGVSVHAVPVTHGWLEIDTVSDYERVRAMMSDGSLEPFFNPRVAQAS
jgi:L-glutamine-phosphate cytidylyltransferase